MRFFKFLTLSAFLMSAFSITAFAVVNSTTYPFSTAAGVSLEDMSSGTTQIIGADEDDAASDVTGIGFTFNFDGTNYTQFSANSNGLMRLGGVGVAAATSGPINSTSNNAKIATYWRDLCTSPTGRVHYRVVGSAPNRKLVVEWQNMVQYNTSCGDGVTLGVWQAWLNENGRVDLVFGTGINANPSGFYTGISGPTATATTSFANVNAALHTASYSNGSANAVTTAGEAGRQYSFTPPGSVSLSSATYSVSEAGSNAVITLNRGGSTSGAASVDITTLDGTAVAPGDYTTVAQTVNFASNQVSATVNVPIVDDALVEGSENFNVVISNPMGVVLGSVVASVVTITDYEPIAGGTYTVGGGGSYPSLTGVGGIFEAINNAGGATGPVTINITSDLTGETGAVALNELPGSPAITIRPSGGPRRISGNAPIAVIRLDGADNVTINGSTTASLVGGNESLRELTVINESTLDSSVVIAVSSGASGASGNTIKNVQVIGNDPLTTLVGIALGGATPGNPGADNDNNRVENCYVSKAQYGIYSAGLGSANQNTGTVITQNNLGATLTGRIQKAGIVVFNESGVQITENLIGGLNSSISADAIGIGVGTFDVTATNVTSGGVTDAMVSRNKINGVTQDNTYSAVGIAVAGGAGGANTIVNNMISGVIGDSNADDIVAGIWIAGVPLSSTRVFNNTVSMTGNRSALLTPDTGQFPSYGIAITGTDPTVELKNNIFYNTQTAELVANPGAFSYAIGMESTAFTNLDSNFNLFFSGGANDGGFRTASLTTTTPTDFATVALWATAVADDANSIEADPQFTDPASNLHILVTSPAKGIGTPLASVTVDFDGQARPNTALTGNSPEGANYDVGGDEFYAPTAANVSLRGRVKTTNGNPLRNVRLTISGGNLTEPRIVTTSSLGIYEFEDLLVGETYIVTVQSKRFTITEPVRVISLNGAIEDFDFTALEP